MGETDGFLSSSGFSNMGVSGFDEGSGALVSSEMEKLGGGWKGARLGTGGRGGFSSGVGRGGGASGGRGGASSGGSGGAIGASVEIFSDFSADFAFTVSLFSVATEGRAGGGGGGGGGGWSSCDEDFSSTSPFATVSLVSLVSFSVLFLFSEPSLLTAFLSCFAFFAASSRSILALAAISTALFLSGGGDRIFGDHLLLAFLSYSGELVRRWWTLEIVRGGVYAGE